MMQSVDEHRNRADGIVGRLLHDPMFRQGLLEDPGQALRAAGFEFGDQDSGGVPPLAVFAAQRTKCPTKSTCSKTCGWKTCGNSCLSTCTRTDKKIAE
jgi:hypothetical protein